MTKVLIHMLMTQQRPSELKIDAVDRLALIHMLMTQQRPSEFKIDTVDRLATTSTTADEKIDSSMSLCNVSGHL